MLKSAITVFLIGLFLAESLFPNVELVELIKLPDLLEHFEKHQQETPGITFTDFLNLHYGNSIHVSSDLRHHSRLPFSKAHHHSYFSCLQVIESPEQPLVSTSFAFLRRIEDSFYIENKVNTPSLGVWQPPKAA